MKAHPTTIRHTTTEDVPTLVEFLRCMLIDMAAVGGHQGMDPRPVGTVSAALILADNTDIHRSRVRKSKTALYTEVDNLHAATESSALVVDQRQRTITLELTVNEEQIPVNAYFGLFLPRVSAMRASADVLNSSFRLVVNKSRLL